MTKIVYQLDGNGYFAGEAVADESPLEPGVYLVPAGCVDAPPPKVADGMCARWTGEAWTEEPIQAAAVEAPSDEELAAAARRRRNALLRNCDYTQLPDAPVDVTAWTAYRQALRDITAQPGFPAAIDWPDPPAT